MRTRSRLLLNSRSNRNLFMIFFPLDTPNYNNVVLEN